METLVNGSYFENTYLISCDKDAILVDPGEGLDKYIDQINKYNIRGIILTHAHIDHIDGIKYFKCPIYIYKDEVDVLNNDDYNLYNMHQKTKPFDAYKLNLVKLNDNDSFFLLGHKFRVLHTPGHTLGSACYIMDDKIMFSGDTLFQVGIGRIDFPTGNANKMIESLQKIKKLDKGLKIYPGHGVSTTLDFELKYNEYLINA